MEFGPVPVTRAEGAILAHAVTLGAVRYGKGRMLSALDCAALAGAGLTEVTVARLGPGDIGEDRAAQMLAGALVPDPVASGLEPTPAHTGRVNLKATGPGILLVDTARLIAANSVDPAITIATLPPHARLQAGQIVATVKIITYGVEGALLRQAADLAGGAMRRLMPVFRSATLILTETEETAPNLSAKGRTSVGGRLRALGLQLAEVVTVRHTAAAVANALEQATGEIALILTAAATSDPADVAPAAVRGAGGVVDRFGIPADPGNLLFLGRVGAMPVVGLPGCARSPALNGADWVLNRVVCGVPISPADFAALGVGGLLKETSARGQSRDPGEG